MKKLWSFLALMLFASSAHAADATFWTKAARAPNHGEVTLTNPTPEQAIMDADQAIAAKDFSFLATYGFAVNIPGCNGTPAEGDMVAQNGVKTVRDTGDSFKSAEAQRFDQRANEYAARYNQEILAALAAQPLTKSGM